MNLRTSFFPIALPIVSLVFSGVAMAAAPTASTVPAKFPATTLLDVVNNKYVGSTQVRDSVFYYQDDELDCPAETVQNAGEKTCVAKVDHWEEFSCFKGPMEGVCDALTNLFAASSKSLIEDGAEEDIELLSCDTSNYVPTISYKLKSYYDGANVIVKDKWIMMCPIFIH